MPSANSDAAEPGQVRDTALGCYRTALEDLAHYAIELDGEATANYQQALSSLAAQAETADPDVAIDLLRDYRGKAAAYVARLGEELTITARSLRQILESLAEVDGDCEGRVGSALARLREAARSPAAGDAGEPLRAASTAIEEGLVGMRQRHEAAVSQLLGKVRTMHKRIDQLESAASLDLLTALASRADMEKRIESLPAGMSRLVLLSLTGLRLAKKRFNGKVQACLAGAFVKRLSAIVPAGTVIGRWSEEEFMVILPTPQEPTARAPNAFSEQLSGAYACLQDGKTVRPTLQVRAASLNPNQLSELPRVTA